MLQDELNKAAKKAAARRIADLLTSPQHLTNVDQLKEATIKKKSSLEAQIKSLLQTQLEDARQSYILLDESNNLIGNVRSDMKQIDSLCGDSQILIPDKVFGIVRKVDRTRENILNTFREISRLIKIPEMVEKIENLLQDDMNILQVYIETRALIKMRDGAYQRASGKADEQRVLQIACKQIDDLIHVFEERLFTLAELAYKLAQKQPAVLVKVVQIVEKSEGTKDLLRVNIVARDAALRKSLIESEQDPDNEMNYPKFHRYREKFFQAVRNGITKRFDKILKKKEENPDNNNNEDLSITPSEMMDKIQTLVDDLTAVLDDLVPCFPESYNIFEFYVKEYHLRINTKLLLYSADPESVSNQEIVDLIAWIQNYNGQIARLGVEDPQPTLMESIEPLLEYYSVRLRTTLDSWISNAIEQDRNSDPVLLDGIYITPLPSEIFEMIQQQIDIAHSIEDAKFLYVVLQECAHALTSFQQRCTELLEQGLSDMPPEHIMAQINNPAKCCDLMEDLEQKVQELFENNEELTQQAEQLFAPMIEGFQSISYAGINAAVNQIFSELQEAGETLFQKEWYDGPVVDRFVDIIEGYFKYAEGYMMESFFRKMVGDGLCVAYVVQATETLDRLIDMYMIQLLVKKHPPITSNTAERLADDEEMIRNFFLQFCRKKLVAQKLQVLVDMRDMIDSDQETIALAFYGFLKNTPDASIDIVIALLNMRSDLDKSQRSQAELACRRIIEQQQKEKERDREKEPEAEQAEVEPSLFTRLDLNTQVKNTASKGFFF